MRLTLQRHYLGAEYTLGALFLMAIRSGSRWKMPCRDGVRRPMDMDAQHEDPGKTAIPSGQYEVTVTWSARFSRPLPLLLRVPDFEAVRIHGATQRRTRRLSTTRRTAGR